MLTPFIIFVINKLRCIAVILSRVSIEIQQFAAIAAHEQKEAVSTNTIANYLTQTAMCCLAADSLGISGHSSPQMAISFLFRGIRYSMANGHTINAAPEVWNKLTVHIRQKPTFSTFSKQLKTFLFRRAYNYS